MAGNVSASFTGPDGPIGNAETGQPFEGGRGTVTRKNGRGFAANSNPGAYRVVEMGAGGYDVDISLQIGSGGGQAIYFREKDVNNWWRLSQRYYGYTVGGGSATIYTWAQFYQNDYGIQNGIPGQTAEISTYSSSPPSFAATLNGLPQYGGAYLARTQQQDQSYTAYAYELRLEKCVAGVVSLVRSTATNALASLTVSARWFEIKVFTSASPTTPVWTLQDATHETATRHGFGYAETTQLGNSDGVDNLTITVLNQPPNAPTVTLPKVVDRTQDLQVDVGYNGKTASDAASASYLRYRLKDTTTWTVVSRTGADTRVTLPGGSLPLGDVEVQGASKSAAGLPATEVELIWSGSVFTEAALPPANLTFVTPTAGAPLTGPTATFTVSVPDLDSLQYRVLGDLNGLPDEAVVIDPGGTKATGDLRTFEVVGLQNGTTVHVQARPILDTLTVPYTSRQHAVTFTPPAEPLVSDTPVRLGSADGTDAIAVQMLNPVPSGGAPAVRFNRLRRRIAAVGGDGILLENPATGQVLEVPPRATYFDGTAPHGVEVQYRAEAFASNGTSTLGRWSSGPLVVDPDAPALDDTVTPTVQELV